MSSEPTNPEGLIKPTADDLEQLANGRTPDLMHLLSKVDRTIRSLTRPINGIDQTPMDQRSAAALRRVVDAVVCECALEIESALLMHPAKEST